MDIASPYGAPVVATGDGVVTFSGRHGGLGNKIIVDHGYGLATVYGHNSKIVVKEGDRVQRGTIIAYIGSTGRSTGPHLHYEVLVSGIPVDPLRYILEQL
jgi:murein DD-endopeptidase MepM/ murein hydrolase activator NlpD